MTEGQSSGRTHQLRLTRSCMCAHLDPSSGPSSNGSWDGRAPRPSGANRHSQLAAELRLHATERLPSATRGSWVAGHNFEKRGAVRDARASIMPLRSSLSSTAEL